MKQPATSDVLSPTFLSNFTVRSTNSTRSVGIWRFSSSAVDAPEKAPPTMTTS